MVPVVELRGAIPAAVLAGLDDSMANMEISVVMFIEFDGVRYESAGLTTTLGAHTGRLPA